MSVTTALLHPERQKDLSSYPKSLPTNTPRHIPQDHDKAREQITVSSPLYDPVLSRIHNTRTCNPRCICAGPLCAVPIDHSNKTCACIFFLEKSKASFVESCVCWWKVVFVIYLLWVGFRRLCLGNLRLGRYWRSTFVVWKLKC
jgi:hypothetical protein